MQLLLKDLVCLVGWMELSKRLLGRKHAEKSKESECRMTTQRFFFFLPFIQFPVLVFVLFLAMIGHDRSDGGLIVAALEMAFAGNCGLDLDLSSSALSSSTPASGGVALEQQLEILFAEEVCARKKAM